MEILRADQRVLEVVDLLQQVRCLSPPTVEAHLPVPHVPLVEGDPHAVVAALDGLHVVEQAAVLGEDLVDHHTFGEKRGRVAVVVAAVAVRGEEVDLLPAVLEDGAIPQEVGGHQPVAASACGRLYRRVEPLHQR